MSSRLLRPSESQNPVNPQRGDRLAGLRRDLAQRIARHTPQAGEHKTAIPGLSLYRRSDPTPCYPGTYEPSLNVFVQGQKRVTFGDTSYLCDETSFLVTAVDVPVMSQIITASSQTPLLSMLLTLDVGVVREVLARQEFQPPPPQPHGRGIAVGASTAELLEPCCRLVGLLDAPADIAFMSPLLQREILYRLLSGPQGERLRAIATAGTQSQSTARAVAWLRANYTRPLRLEELAEIAHMGVSTLRRHFHALTAMSPLQYQKHLRLVAARERMLMDGLDAASAAFDVGYESPSQFNREYKRVFGQSPLRDIASRRTLVPSP